MITSRFMVGQVPMHLHLEILKKCNFFWLRDICGVDITLSLAINSPPHSANRAEKMINRIIRDRDAKITRYGCESYAEFMLKNKKNNANAPGFWSKAVLLNEEVN